MRNTVLSGSRLLSVAAAALLMAVPKPAGAGPALNQAAHHRVLFLVGGIVHDYEKAPGLMVDALKSRLENRAAFEFTVSQDLGLLQASELKKYDLLMLNVCQQPKLSADQKSAVLSAVVNGMPVVALHCSFWSFVDWPEYHQMMGAYLYKHARYGPMPVEVIVKDHPVVAGVAPAFELTDEPDMPEFADSRDPSVKVLVQTVKTYEGRSRPEAQVWVKTFGKGRVFAMTFGHDLKSQQEANFLQLLANGLVWAVGTN